MKPRRLNNQRLVAWLLMLALLFVALPSGASWQCLNGRLCSQNCPMLAQGVQSAPTCAASVSFRCAKCLPDVTLAAPTEAIGRCPQSQCVLRAQSKPDAALTHKIAFSIPLLALPPPPAQVLTVFADETAQISFPLPLLFALQRLRRPYSGRAPPILL